MARKNNKGFSLVEVVIAVAILSLLLSPILVQLVQSLKTSTEAKEKQYAIENAESVLEYFQKTDIKDIGKDGFASSTYMKRKDNISCIIASRDGASVGAVEYSAYDYTLNSVKLGKRQNTYSRKVLVDDLATKLVAKGYRIVYELTDSEKNALEGQGFVATSEGSMVKYDRDGYVVGVVCTAYTYSNDTYVNPNEVSLGFIQNLDAKTVAIIQGAASNFDAQAEADFYSLKMQHLKEVNFPAWEQAMNHVNGENIFSSNTFSETTNKVTEIKTNAVMNGATVSYYEVTCKVYYTDSYSIPKETGGTEAENDKLTYNVFAQKFYTNKSPDIYFIYEPFVDSSSQNNASYASKDYIAINNDEKTVGSKIYLIKPEKTQQSEKVTLPSSCEKDVYYTKASGNWKPVKIDIFRSGNNVSCDALKIYTNLSVDKQDFIYEIPSVLTTSLSMSTANYPDTNVAGIDADTRYDGRLYTASVVLKRLDDSGNAVSGYDIRLQGGKGAD